MIDPKDRDKLYLCNRGCVWRVRETDSRGVTMKLFATPDLSMEVRIVKSIFSNLEFVTDEVDRSMRKFRLDGKKGFRFNVKHRGYRRLGHHQGNNPMKLRVGGTYMAQDGTVFYCYAESMVSNEFHMADPHTRTGAGGYWFEDGLFERFDHPRNLVKEILP